MSEDLVPRDRRTFIATGRGVPGLVYVWVGQESVKRLPASRPESVPADPFLFLSRGRSRC